MFVHAFIHTYINPYVYTIVTINMYVCTCIHEYILSCIACSTCSIKMLFETCRDFDALIYLCEPTFWPQPLDTYQRLSVNFLLQCYCSVVIVIFATVAQFLSSYDKVSLVVCK